MTAKCWSSEAWAGIGKSALLDHLVDRATGFRVFRSSGVESEMQMAFGGLHQLCSPMLDLLDTLPEPQHQALATAFGLHPGNAPDRFLVGLAVLSLVANTANETPVVCVIDDAQWLDQVSAQTLAFVARRLLADRVALVLAVREPVGEDPFRGLPEHHVLHLNDHDAGALLDARIPGLLDQRVRSRIIAEARGNPLAVLYLPHDDLMAGGYRLPSSASLTSRIEESFIGRVRQLPEDAQLLLLAAAAEPLGDALLLRRAAELLEIDSDAPRLAEAAGLLTVDTSVRFRHPLVRSATYRAASPDDRRGVHGALATATDPRSDPDRRAWHRAHAVSGYDEAVADDLERSADRAERRGGLAAAAAFLELAAQRTADPERRAVRSIAAGQALLDAGAPEAAEALLAVVEVSMLGELEQARLVRLRARLRFAQQRDSDAAPLLLEAAERLRPLDAVDARDTMLEALGAMIFTGRLERGHDVVEAVHEPDAEPLTSRAKDLLLVGLATRATEGFAAGAERCRAALEAFRVEPGDDPDTNRWLWLACRVAADLFEHETWSELAHRAVRIARRDGALSVLPIAASYLAGVHMHAGEYREAAMLMDESAAISLAMHAEPLITAVPMLAAYRGHETEAIAEIERTRDGAAARGQSTALSMIDCAHAVLYNGLGRYEPAREAAERACAHDDLSLFAVALVELVEAATRTDRPEVAATTMERLSERTQAAGTDWALGLEARSRALVADDDTAEEHFQEAVKRLERCNVAPHHARAQLVYGEWLRRGNQRVRAREQLRAAHATFTRIGAHAFAERCRRELAASGETVRTRTPESLDTLTPQESQIAELAADGLTNPEIGARLFLSPHTVEWHLRKVFVKLGIHSRTNIHEALQARDRP